MAFSLDDHWVWDFWLADDGTLFHLFYLHAPHALGDPDLRHRNARIGHATSTDLMRWTDHGQIFDVGAPGSFDASATWTGSVIRGPDGLWRMFYTGSRFLSADSGANIETVGMATSQDLFTWTKSAEPVCSADPRWYETLGTSSWPEEAWRDPWVFYNPADGLWHMLITARSNRGDDLDRGVIGHAVSSDLTDWQVQPPLSTPGAGFAHLEVPQIVHVDERPYLIFCCDAAKLAGRLKGEGGGNWYVPLTQTVETYPVNLARRLSGETLYAGRIVTDRFGRNCLMAFENTGLDGEFVGRISDPMPIDLLATDPMTGVA